MGIEYRKINLSSFICFDKFKLLILRNINPGITYSKILGKELTISLILVNNSIGIYFKTSLFDDFRGFGRFGGLVVTSVYRVPLLALDVLCSPI